MLLVFSLKCSLEFISETIQVWWVHFGRQLIIFIYFVCLFVTGETVAGAGNRTPIFLVMSLVFKG